MVILPGMPEQSSATYLFLEGCIDGSLSGYAHNKKEARMHSGKCLAFASLCGLDNQMQRQQVRFCSFAVPSNILKGNTDYGGLHFAQHGESQLLSTSNFESGLQVQAESKSSSYVVSASALIRR